jgi:hypothetical protein
MRSGGVEIELRYRHAAFLAAVEEPWSAAALVKRVRWTGGNAYQQSYDMPEPCLF